MAPAKGRASPPNNHISGLTYDSSGNTQTDGNYTYTWDGESQLKTAAGVTYNYDGDGRRVAKVGSKLYWYGSGGEILSETDAAGNTQNEYIFFGGKRVAMVPAAGSALYYAEDQLGSSRVIVQSNGTLCYDADFTPFGAERSYVSTCAQNYKFEGKERDTETQNDDFGARFYSWRFGRWLSSDWSAVPVPVPYANLTNPQTLNLYSMVADDPGSFADLDGHEGFWGAVLAQQWDQAAEEEQTQASQTVQQSSVTQTDTISAAQPAQNAGVRQLDPNSQECKDLAKKIDNIASDIKKRDQEVAANPLNLPETAPPGSPPRSSVEGHRQIIKDLIDNLGAAADLYNNKCGGGPPPPLSPVVNTVPVPVGPPSSISPKAIVGVIVVGAAIALIPETGGLSLAAVF